MYVVSHLKDTSHGEGLALGVTHRTINEMKIRPFNIANAL